MSPDPNAPDPLPFAKPPLPCDHDAVDESEAVIRKAGHAGDLGPLSDAGAVGIELVGSAVGAAGEVVGGAAEVVGGALEGASGCLDGCGGCASAVLIVLFASAGTAMALWR